MEKALAYNPEIIDEAGRDRLFYLTRQTGTHRGFAVPGTDENEAAKHLRDLFGFAGYIGIARSMVFLEGQDSSSDRKMFSSLFPEYAAKVKFVPAKTVGNLNRLNATVLSILESNIGEMQFYLLRDQDLSRIRRSGKTPRTLIRTIACSK